MTALDPTRFLCHDKAPEEGARPMKKPRTSLYGMHGGLAVTTAGQPVAILTVSVVAR